MQEAHLGRVADPAGGAWYLESLTDALARTGWAFLQAIESKGGAASAIESGFIADAVAKARADRKARPIVGVSDFKDPDPKPVPIAPAKPGAAQPRARTTAFKPLIPIRFSEPFEAADPS
jgi:methylmalonyl-CoA mutase